MPDSQTAPRNILLLSGGSKVAIANIAKQAAKRRGLELHISDTSSQVPTFAIADHFTQLPEHKSPYWADELKKLCFEAKIRLIIPTRHSELLELSKLVPSLSQNGTVVSLSEPKTLTSCIHKLDTYHFLRSIGIPTPTSCLRSEFDNQIEFPLIAKPERGSSSNGATIISSQRELKELPADWLLQEKAEGTEYTVNVYLSKTGRALCAIPHERIIVEAGEVVQAKTRRHQKLIEACVQIAEQLPGASGIINIQAFVDETANQISVIEINPRIGGGYPLCDAAKGHYIEWLCQEHIDNKEVAPFVQWTENLLMMRYREAMFSL
ncbi:ATP-grasp domain-containing protein [Pelagicoccus sp. SDUM812002]|uniref:ATP-grasp domain-containing protein n=1 Tax=Pelagicoccus sp. SDUM812002 TaxID=3041266 RepID=UPI00280EDC03|nr:ATP-grasp domain-containing protein [Pelagicoccus sp. SDUM812002]MDQ8186185.1 ATP-grasp domain-containing protein [Pelagicoccus sp. SDUM812002]